MAYLRIPRRRWLDTKPTEPVAFDRGYIEESGLVGAWILNEPEPRDLSGNGNHAVRVGASPKTTATPHGVGYNIPAGTNNHRLALGSITSDNPLSLSTGTMATIMGRGIIPSQTSQFPRFIDKSNSGAGAAGWQFSADDRGSEILNFSRNGSTFASNAGVYVHGQWFSAAVAFDSEAVVADEAQFFVNGAAAGSQTLGIVGSFPGTTTNAAIGQWNHATTDRHWSGVLEYVYVHNVVLPEQEIARVHREPYRYLVPTRSRTWFVPAAVAPGGFQPAWARGSTVTIQHGVVA